MPTTAGALGTRNVSVTEAATFIPELWSDEIIASYEKNLVMAPLVRSMDHTGKKGDTIHIPSPIRGTAQAKAAKTTVQIQNATESEVQVLIDKHYEYSRLIEDIVDVQAQSSLRMFYTEDAGYALARQKDTDIINLGRDFNGGAGNDSYLTGTFIGSDGSTAYDGTNGAALTDAGIRRFIQRLDDNDVPMSQRYLVVPPAERNNLMGLARFTEQAFVGEVGGGNTIRNGLIGDLYGVKVYVTPQCDTTDQADTARIGLMFHRDVAVVVSQLGVRSQVQYKQEYLGDLLTSDHIYGVKTLRAGNAEVPASGFAIALAA